MLNPQYKKTYNVIYHDVFKPLKVECEMLYDEENPHAYMQHTERDNAINELVFAQLTNPREQQRELTRDLLGRFRQALGASEWENAIRAIPAFIADVREHGLPAVVMALPRDQRVMGSSANAATPLPMRNASTSAAIISGDKLKDAVKSLNLDEALLAKLKKTDS